MTRAFEGPEPGGPDDVEWPGEAPGHSRPDHEYRPWWEYGAPDPGVLPPKQPVGWNANGSNGASGEPVFVDAYEFVKTEVEVPPPLWGTRECAIIPQGGLAILAGRPGAGKTTFVLDLACHLAAGLPFPNSDGNGRAPAPWPIDKPLRVALIENEGPQEMFRLKLADKLERFPHDIRERGGYLSIQAWRWGAFNFADADAHRRAQSELESDGIDLVIGDPLTMLGPRGVGSPEDTRVFVQMLYPLGLAQSRAFLFLHHFRERAERNEDELARVSGAWGGHLDTLLTLQAGAQKEKARLSFPKLRWASEKPPNAVILGRVYNTASFEALSEEGDHVALEAPIVTWLEAQRAAGRGAKGWFKARDVAHGISEGDMETRKALEGAPHLFSFVTGARAKELGARANAKLWGLKEWADDEPEETAGPEQQSIDADIPF